MALKFHLQGPYFSFFPTLCMYLYLTTLSHEFLDNFHNTNKILIAQYLLHDLTSYFLACSGAKERPVWSHVDIKTNNMYFFRKI